MPQLSATMQKFSSPNTIVIGDATTATNVVIGATTAGSYKLRVSQGVGSFGFDLFNATSSNHWEHYVTNSPGSTQGGDPYTAGDMLLYYNNGGFACWCIRSYFRYLQANF